MTVMRVSKEACRPLWKDKGLGTLIESALKTVGVTSERVSAFLGRPCKCPERVEKLNSISNWARMTVKDKLQDAKEQLERLIG